MVTKRATNRTVGAGQRVLSKSQAKNGKRRVTSVSLVVPTRNEAGYQRARRPH